MNAEDRSGVPDTDMAVTEGEEESPPPDPNTPATAPTGEAETHSDPAAALQAEPELPQKFQPPEGGNPWSLRVDGTEVPIDGARIIDDYIVLPRDVWDHRVQPNYVGDRGVWKTRAQKYENDIRTLREQTIPEERTRAQAMLAQLDGMLDGTPQGRDKLIAWLENYEQNAPILKVQAELRLKEERLAKYEAEKAEADAARQAEELRPRLQSYLGDQVKEATREFKQLAGQKDLTDRVWRFHAARLFYEDHNKQVQFDHTLFRELMEDEAKRVQVQAVKTEQVAAVAKKNAAAVGPARTAEGKFAKPTTTAPKPSGRMTAEEWEERFAKKKYS